MAGGVGKWLDTHRTEAMVGLAAGVGGFALYRSKKSGSAPGASTTTTAAAPGVSGAYGPYDSSQLDQYNQLAGAISNANDQIAAIQAELASHAVSQLPPAPSGSGLRYEPVIPEPIQVAHMPTVRLQPGPSVTV